MPRIPIGQRIRDRRKLRNISQVALAQTLGISPSYLNLIEHDKRLVGSGLMRRLALALDVELSWLRGTEDDRLAHDVLEITRSLPLQDLESGTTKSEEMSDQGAARFVALNPGWAAAFRSLHGRYRAATETAIALSDRLSQDPALIELSHAVLSRITSIRSFAEILEHYQDLDDNERQRFSAIIATESEKLGSSARAMIELLGGEPGEVNTVSPAAEVDDFIIGHSNHFPSLEREAERMRGELMEIATTLSAAISGRLTTRHGVEIRTGDPSEQDAGRSFGDMPVSRIVHHVPGTPEASRRFEEARLIAGLELEPLIAELIDDRRLTTDAARAMAQRALASYAAGAILFPYETFLRKAEAFRYDVDRLAAVFGGSFEQTAHRLVTLRRPMAEGIPFAFLRTDPAGNLSKPFSMPGLRLPRMGSACPLWALYAALSQPERTLAQLAVMPQGEQYLFIARRISKPAFYGEPPTVFSVMLGCEAGYADQTVYGDSLGRGRSAIRTETGFTCRSCPRANCRQRAVPALYGPGV